jgi:hypothetical protein
VRGWDQEWGSSRPPFLSSTDMIPFILAYAPLLLTHSLSRSLAHLLYPAEICETLYAHPEGLDPPCGDLGLYEHCTDPSQTSQFASITAKAGDIFITHGLLPHAHTPNYLHYPRIITNPHVNLVEPWNLNREDGDYVSSTILIEYKSRKG